MNITKTSLKFGDICYADLPADDSVEGGYRPVIIIQNDRGNFHSSVTEVIALTSQITPKKIKLPMHVYIEASDINGLTKDSIALIEQKRPIPIKRIDYKIGTLEKQYYPVIAKAIETQNPFWPCS